MKPLQKIISILFLLVLSSMLYAQEDTLAQPLQGKIIDIDYSNCLVFFKYENYAQPGIKVQEYFLNDVVAKKSLLYKEKQLQAARGYKIEGDLFDILCNQKVINGWDAYSQLEPGLYSSNYNEFVEERKKELNLEYLGKLDISQTFESFLVLDLYEGELTTIKHVFLVNVSNNAITSITKVCAYFSFNGDCLHTFTKKVGNNLFVQREVELSSDAIYPKGMELKEEKVEIKFTYDESGRLKILNKQ